MSGQKGNAAPLLKGDRTYTRTKKIYDNQIMDRPIRPLFETRNVLRRLVMKW